MNRRPLILTVAGLLALLASPATRADVPVIFSKPTPGAGEQVAPAAETAARKISSNPSAIPSLFNSKPRGDFDILPGYQPPTPLSPAQVKELQKQMDQRKNWALMTPEEILGLPTPAKIMGVADPDQNLSTEERYLKRQNRQRSASATNALANAGSLGNQDQSAFKSWRSGQEQNANDRFGNQNGLTRPERTDRFGTRNANSTTEDLTHRPDSPWSSAFNVPPEPPKPDKSQMAAMERFRAMMQPSEPERPLPNSPTLGAPAIPTTPNQPVAATPSPNFQRLDNFNPGGNSYRPVQETVSRPIGITPLPTTTGVRPTAVNQTKPKPLTEPPPWVAEQNRQNKYATPKPGVFSQRKF